MMHVKEGKDSKKIPYTSLTSMQRQKKNFRLPPPFAFPSFLLPENFETFHVGHPTQQTIRNAVAFNSEYQKKIKIEVHNCLIHCVS